MAESQLARVIDRAIAQEYDLCQRAEVGDRTYYAYCDRYLTLGRAGEVDREEVASSFMTQEVVHVRDDGAPVYNWVRHRSEYRILGNGQRVEPTPFEFGEGLSYQGCFEDSWEFLPLDHSLFPPSLEGFLMFELIIHPSVFGMLTSRTHAAVDRLQRVGDSVVMPMGGKRVAVDFPGFIAIDVQRGESRITFEGLSQYGSQAAALLTAQCPQTFPEIQGGKGRGDVTAMIWVGLNGGPVLRGTFQQTNYLALPLGPEGTVVPLNQVVQGSLRRIGPEDYPS